MENTPTSNTSESLVDLPIAQIKENPDNPRHLITQEMTEAMAASLKAVGLKNPIKVRKLTLETMAKDGTGVATSQTAPIGAAPRNDSNSNTFEYELISGHIRLAGAQLLGWTTIKALVKDLTPQEALLEAILDNRGQEMTWLDLYQSIESLMKADPNLTQQEVGDRLEIDRSVVSRALKLLAVLNPISRTLICENFTKPGGYQVPESCVRRLGDLEKTQSPHLPDLVQRALGVVLRKKMGEPQAARMVTEILKTGITPEAYEEGLLAMKERAAVKGVDPDDPNREYWQNLPSNVQVKWNAQGYRVTMDLSPAEAPVGVYGAMAWLEHMKHKAVGTHDPRFAKALPGLTEGLAKAYKVEQAKAVEQKAKSQAQETSKSEAKPEIATSPSAPIGAAPRNDEHEAVVPSSTIDEATYVETSPYAKASGDGSEGVPSTPATTPAAKAGGLGGW